LGVSRSEFGGSFPRESEVGGFGESGCVAAETSGLGFWCRSFRAVASSLKGTGVSGWRRVVSGSEVMGVSAASWWGVVGFSGELEVRVTWDSACGVSVGSGWVFGSNSECGVSVASGSWVSRDLVPSGLVGSGLGVSRMLASEIWWPLNLEISGNSCCVVCIGPMFGVSGNSGCEVLVG
jgi:hypothetical protein